MTRSPALRRLLACASLLVIDSEALLSDSQAVKPPRLKYSLGPRAPRRVRRKRLAKKLAKRGNMLRARGLLQTYSRTWPAMTWWFS